MLKTVSGFDRIGEENAFAVLARANALAAEGRDIINLGIGQPDFTTPPHIVEAGVKALRDGHHGYTPAPGIPALREAVAADIEMRTGVATSPDHILIVPGGKVTMYMAIDMFGEPGAEILYPDPGFPIYRSMIEYTGATPIPIPIREENGFAFSPDDVAERLSDKTRLVIINSPANPTGGVTPAEDVRKLASIMAARPDIALMSDEIYGRMTYDGERHLSLGAFPELRDQLILLDGFSKTYAMTGWRLGWSLWPASLFDKSRKLAVNAWSCVNAPAQFAGVAALTGPQDGPEAMVRAFDDRRLAVVEALNALPGISCATPKGAFYAFPNIKGTGWKAKPLADALLNETGVALIGGPDFGTLGEGYIRVSYAAAKDRILEAMARIDTFLQERAAA
ncbi:MAG: pyridoxal phosphate-dependent aminotransferase [Pseudomonadota bacterium]